MPADKGPSPSLTKRGAVLVAENDGQLCHSLTKSLRRAGFRAEGVTTGEQAAALLKNERFDVLLADTSMPGNAKLELLPLARALGTAALLMTGDPNLDSAVGAMRGGAADYLTKPIPAKILLGRLDEAVHKSRVSRAAPGAGESIQEQDRERLSQREREILALLSVGNSAKEIAVTLGLSGNTVRNHIKSIFAKLRVHSQVELLVKLRHG